MQIRDRIVGFERILAKNLKPNPKNWRTHPEQQRNALRGVLAEIGYADALLGRRGPDGTVMLIDGHLRAETTPDMEVPVLLVDLDDREADLLLATLDPISACAGRDDALLAELLGGIEAQNEAVREMLDGMRIEENEIGEGSLLSDEVPEDNTPIDEEAMRHTEHECPSCGFKW